MRGSQKRNAQLEPPAATVPEAMAFLDREAPASALSIRVERAYCGSSIKDGRFAVAWLRVAAGAPSATREPTATHLVRTTLDDPGESCRSAAVALAFERVLALRDVRDILGARREPAGRRVEAGEATGGEATGREARRGQDTRGAQHTRVAQKDEVKKPGYSAATTRALFPALAWRAAQEVDRGRRHLAVGNLEQAQVHFERAAAIDPEDPAAVAFLDEVSRSLAIARSLEADGRVSPPLPQLTEAQRTGMEAQLAYETKRREEMLSALAVLYETRNAPTPGTIANIDRKSVV